MNSTSDQQQGQLGRPRKQVFRAVKAWSALIRDIGAIIGIPVVATVAVHFWNIEKDIAEHRDDERKAEIAVKDALIDQLKSESFKEAHEMIESSRKDFDLYKSSMSAKISAMHDKLQEDSSQIDALKSERDNVIKCIQEAEDIEGQVQELIYGAQGLTADDRRKITLKVKDLCTPSK